MNKELKEVKKLRKFIEEMRRKKQDITYNKNDDFLKDLETVLNYIENSIPKEKVEKELQELKNMKVGGEVFTTSVNFAIKVLEDLLKGK